MKAPDAPAAVVERVRACLVRPSEAHLEQASGVLLELHHRLSGHGAALAPVEARQLLRQLEELRRLAEHAAGYYSGLAEVLQSLPASYTAAGAPEPPSGHQLSVHG